MYGCMLLKDCPLPVFPVLNPDILTERPLVSADTASVPASAEIAVLANCSPDVGEPAYIPPPSFCPKNFPFGESHRYYWRHSYSLQALRLS